MRQVHLSYCLQCCWTHPVTILSTLTQCLQTPCQPQQSASPGDEVLDHLCVKVKADASTSKSNHIYQPLTWAYVHWQHWSRTMEMTSAVNATFCSLPLLIGKPLILEQESGIDSNIFVIFLLDKHCHGTIPATYTMPLLLSYCHALTWWCMVMPAPQSHQKHHWLGWPHVCC